MKFDLLAQAIERFVPAFRTALDVAALISAPRFEPETMQCNDLDVQFRLPWNCVCIEDDVSVVLIQRRGRLSTQGGQEAVDESSRIGTRDIGLQRGDCFRFACVHEHRVTKGRPAGVFADRLFVENVRDQGGYASVGWSIGPIEGVDGDRHLVYELGSDRHAEIARHLIENVNVALSQCAMVTRPSTWIVKRVPTSSEQAAIERRAANPKKAARSGERDRWLLITDKEREKYFRDSAGHAEGDASLRTPHPRRAHFRRIGTNPDGSLRHTWVRACWVGSTEAEIHGSRYRVELDL